MSADHSPVHEAALHDPPELRVLAAGWESLSVDWIISYLRWPWLAVALVLFWINPDAVSVPFLPLYYVIGCAAVHNLLHVAALYARAYRPWFRPLGIGLDLVAAILMMVATGGWSSPLQPVMLFPVLTASITLGLVVGLVAVALVMLAYAITAAVNRDLTQLRDLHLFATNVTILVGTACVAGLLRRRSGGPAAGAPSSGPAMLELETLRRANKRATVVREMATTLSATLSYERVLRTMLELSLIALNESDTVDASLVGLVMLFEQEGDFEQMRVYAGRNMPRADENRVVAGKSEMITRAIYDAEPQITEDAGNDPVLVQLLCTRGASSALCVPLRAGFDIFGIVVLASPQANYFNAEHAELLSTFCHQAALALKNAQLYQNLQSEQRRILEKESEARHKLARELHDGPTQSVSAMAMRLNYTRKMIEKNQPPEKIAEEVAQIEQLARKTSDEVRMMLFTLRPVILETRGLVAALQQYAERMRQADGLNVQVDAQDYRGQLPKDAEGVVFAVIEEAVGNAKKHAKAKTVVIRVRVENQMFRAEVQDDGVGFDAGPARRRREAGHLGLVNMEDRAEYLGGRFSIESHPSIGTRVLLEIPLRQWGAAT
jgi:signal transduction histidine kinase